MKRILFLILITFTFSEGAMFSQSSRVDSMLAFVLADHYDTLKILTYHELFLEFEFYDDEKAKEFLEKALKLAQKIHDDKLLADTYILYGYLAEDKGNYSGALESYFNSLNISRKNNDQTGISIALNNLGLVFNAQGNYPEALKNFLESLKIRNAIAAKDPGNIKNRKGIASSYNNLGNLYYDMNNFPEALKNQLAALEIRKQLDETETIASSYHNIGNIYFAQNNYDAALKKYKEAMEINEKLRNLNWLAKNYDAIGIVYEEQGNYSEVYDNYMSSLKIRKEIGDTLGIALSNLHLGTFFTKQKKYSEASGYLSVAKTIALKIGSKDCLSDVYNALSHIDSAYSDFKGAFENYKMHLLYRDSLDNEESRKKTVQSQMTFDFEKKEAIAEAEHRKELENMQILSEEKDRKQKLIISSVGGGLLLVLMFTFYILRTLRITRTQKDIIEEQRNLVALQKDEMEYQKMRVEEHQKEIIDSITYARRIQHALLPSEKYISRSFARLNPAKNKSVS